MIQVGQDFELKFSSCPLETKMFYENRIRGKHRVNIQRVHDLWSDISSWGHVNGQEIEGKWPFSLILGLFKCKVALIIELFIDRLAL